MAAEKGYVDNLKLVCQEIVNKTPKYNSNKTPFLFAYIKNHWQVVSFLIAANNVDVN